MVYKILKGLDIAITPAIAYNVYGGIFGDTGDFAMLIPLVKCFW